MKPRRDGKSYLEGGPVAAHRITEDEIRVYNYGIKQAQWQVTKAMLVLGHDMPPETKKLLKIIHDNIERELK